MSCGELRKLRQCGSGNETHPNRGSLFFWMGYFQWVVVSFVKVSIIGIFIIGALAYMVRLLFKRNV